MKKLLLIALIGTMLIGCTNDKVKQPEFVFNQSVLVINGFYKGTSGKIIDYRYCRDNTDKLTFCYSIIADGFFQFKIEKGLFESDLIPVLPDNEE